MFAILVACGLCGAAYAARYEQYILMPSSRTLAPTSVLGNYSTGSVTGAESVTEGGSGSMLLSGLSSVTFDYERNIAGVVSINVVSSSGTDQRIGVTFSESSFWISDQHSDTTAGFIGFDDTVYIDTPSAGNFSLPPQLGRGAFRYLTLVHNSTGSVEVSAVKTHFTPMPHFAESQLKNYSGYFHSNDELLNRIWYAGAYTLNLCTVDPKHGNALVSVLPAADGFIAPAGDWFYNYTITNGSAALVDGAKRDTLVWPGDMGIAIPSVLVSTNDMITVKNSLNSLYLRQNPTSGLLPYAGAPLSDAIQSWTYHMYTLIGTYNYFEYTGDTTWLLSVWPKYKLALKFVLDRIDDTGLLFVDPTVASSDWLRTGMGGHNIEANAILYHTIELSIRLSMAVEDSTVESSWSKSAAGIKAAANSLLWNGTLGAYQDNENSTLAPQDGNSWAVIAGLTANESQTASISNFLSSRWGPYGAPAPEATQGNKTAVSPFIGGFELQAHLLAGNATRALDLMRLEWGYMLEAWGMTNSTFIEGYSTDGSLRYFAYGQDSKISHAHGWSSGPTSALTFYVAGIQLQGPSGRNWTIAPDLGDLTDVDAGFQTNLGLFSSKVNMEGDGALTMEFEAPLNTTGSVNVPHPKCDGYLHLRHDDGEMPDVWFAIIARPGSGRFLIEGLQGGKCSLNYTCM